MACGFVSGLSYDGPLLSLWLSAGSHRISLNHAARTNHTGNLNGNVKIQLRGWNWSAKQVSVAASERGCFRNEAWPKLLWKAECNDHSSFATQMKRDRSRVLPDEGQRSKRIAHATAHRVQMHRHIQSLITAPNENQRQSRPHAPSYSPMEVGL